MFEAQITAEAEREVERSLRERVAQRFGRFVPEAIARALAQDEAVLTPKAAEGVVLVLDIEDFTRYAVSRYPVEVIDTLNTFLARCADTIAEREWVVITFLGDDLLVVFNVPIAIAEPTEATLQAAVRLVEVAERSRFKVRIGVASGPVAGKSVGSTSRQAFTRAMPSSAARRGGRRKLTWRRCASSTRRSVN